MGEATRGQAGGTIRHPPGKKLNLKNVTCAFCLKPIGKNVKWNQAHAVGRRFVPAFVDWSREWNLYVRSCVPCNSQEMASLEKELSAITLQADGLGRPATGDARLPAEARRKGESERSHRTGKLVSKSQERTVVSGAFGNASMSFGFRAPPQPLRDRVWALAWFQLRAFFYRLSYDHAARRGGHPPVCRPVIYALRSDWGNPTLRAFESTIRGWAVKFAGITAQGYFKIVIREHPSEQLWAWALEWNQNLRVIGFAGNVEAAVQAAAANLPVSRPVRGHRREVPLPPEDDHLFDEPP